MSVTLQFQHLQFAELYTGMDLQERKFSKYKWPPGGGVSTKANLWRKFNCTSLSNLYGSMNEDVLQETISISLGIP